MKLLMKQTTYGSEDGFAVKIYSKGERYDIANCLAKHFVDSDKAVKS